jgi:peptidoglycan/LPS O-acetylase OafA/YrhL
MLVGSAATEDLNGRSGLLATRTAVRLGDLTFAFYIVQGVTIFYVRWLIGDRTYAVLPALGFMAALFVLNLSGAWVLHRYVEKPSMRRFGRKRVRVAPPEPVALTNAEL